MKAKILNYLKKKAVLLICLTLTLIVLFSIGSDKTETGVRAVIGIDTCVIKHRNFSTGNYWVQAKSGKEFAAKPETVVFLDI